MGALQVFAGVRGFITIHDNILIFGRDVEEHNINLRATLIRAKGVTLKHRICSTEVKLLSRVFSFTDKYLPGKKMPTDYNSRHPRPITRISQQEREALMVPGYG